MKIKHFLCCLPIACVSLAMTACGDETDDPVVTPPIEEEEKTPEFNYQVARISIDTNNKAIESKEDYIPCTVSVESDNPDWCTNTAMSSKIRGRGNSTWLWYPKKPYRIKLDKKASMLGLGEAKSWVLLANYRDPTDMMNTFVFALGQLMELPFTNHTRYVELRLNGKNQGLYQLTEQVQQGKNRVDVDADEGILLSLDRDDGPELAPTEPDNFWSAVYGMPVCSKYPEDGNKLDWAKGEFEKLEKAIQSGYAATNQLMNIGSLIDFLIAQELVYNVELEAPRSMYIHRDKGAKWTMGPLWDFDGGYDFNWTNMTTSHNYFASYKKLVLGTDPANRKGANCYVPNFFLDLFKSRQFVQLYKARWKELKPFIMIKAWGEVELYLKYAQPYLTHDEAMWPIGKTSTSEVPRLKKWLEDRIEYLDGVIMNYPSGTKE